MHKERLLQVVRVLEELPTEKKFDMYNWMTCGTSGCAAGWAASDPWFKKRGFKLLVDRVDAFGRQGYVPSYKGFSEYRACARFFDINQNDAEQLFNPANYVRTQRRDVIHRIKRFVKDGSDG